MHTTCPHLYRPLERSLADGMIKECCEKLKPLDFDTFVFSGNSGALVAPILAYKMHKELIMVRKPNDDCASRHRVEGFTASKRYVIVDDLVSTGKTMARILKGVQGFASREAELVGVLIYNTRELLHLSNSMYFKEVMGLAAEADPTTKPVADRNDPEILKMPIPF